MSSDHRPVWMGRPEGGGRLALWLIRTIALTVGRAPARFVLAFVAAYFVVRRGPERRASRRFLTLALGHPVSMRHVWQHMYTFATVTLDRVFLLTESFRRFEIRTYGLEQLLEALDLSKEDPKIREAYGDGKPYKFQYDGAPTCNDHLLIARRLVEAQGGTIRLESRTGSGARFVIELPVTEAQA